MFSTMGIILHFIEIGYNKLYHIQNSTIICTHMLIVAPLYTHIVHMNFVLIITLRKCFKRGNSCGLKCNFRKVTTRKR